LTSKKNIQIIQSELVDKTGNEKLDLSNDELLENEGAEKVEETEPPKTTKPKTTKPKTTKPKTVDEVVAKHIDKSVNAKQIELDRPLTEAEIIDLEQKFIRKVKQIDSTITGFKSDEDRKKFYDLTLEGFGIPEDQKKKLYALDVNK
jgi:hypothetical protein